MVRLYQHRVAVEDITSAACSRYYIGATEVQAIHFAANENFGRWWRRRREEPAASTRGDDHFRRCAEAECPPLSPYHLHRLQRWQRHFDV